MDALVEVSEGRYRVGERWSYRARPGEEGSLLTVLRVESSRKLGVIVHVGIDGLRMVSPGSPGGVSESIGHMPFAEAAIDESVETRVAAGVSVSAGEGYENWRRAFDAGEAGIFTISVAEGVDFVAQMLSR